MNLAKCYCMLTGSYWDENDFYSRWEEDGSGIDFVLNPVTPVASARCPTCGEEFALYEGDTDVCPYCISKMEVEAMCEEIERRRKTNNYDDLI